MKQSFIPCIIFLLLYAACAYAQEPEIDWSKTPVYQGEDLMIDVYRLRPHRAQLWVRSARYDTLFNNAQVSFTVERGDYYGPDKKPRKGIRIRWVSNTHSFEDAAYVDASTFGIVKQTSIYRSVKEEGFIHAYFGVGHVIHTILSQDSLAQSTKFNLRHKQYYHLIIMPYLFASSDLEAGATFRLPYYSPSRKEETLINVYVRGNAIYTDRLGQEKNAWRVDTDHGYAKMEWYLDKHNPPYLMAYRWRSYSNDTLVSDSKRTITKWIEYEGDDFDDIIIQK